MYVATNATRSAHIPIHPNARLYPLVDLKMQADDMFARSVPSAKMRKYRTYWPSGFHKEDRAGRPVFYDRVGQVDLTALRTEPDALDMDDMVKIFCQNMEVLRISSSRDIVLASFPTRLSGCTGYPTRVCMIPCVLNTTCVGVEIAKCG